MNRLYALLLDAERLLEPGVDEHPSLDERIAQVVERGWDDTRAVPQPTGRPPHAASAGTAMEADVQSRDRVPGGGSSSDIESVPAGVPARGPEERQARLDELARQIRVCEACPLSLGRTSAVPGEGVLDPLVMVVGEGPGYNEDRQGRPFVGKAGAYLDTWLDSIGLHRDRNAFIANIVKCRPPNNRDPKPEESDACAPYLREQIALVRPQLIMTVGRISTRILTGATQGITRIHGSFYRYEGIPLVPTFHPSAVLRNPDYRRPVWEDLKKIRNWLIDNAGHQVASTD